MYFLLKILNLTVFCGMARAPFNVSSSNFLKMCVSLRPGAKKNHKKKATHQATQETLKIITTLERQAHFVCAAFFGLVGMFKLLNTRSSPKKAAQKKLACFLCFFFLWFLGKCALLGALLFFVFFLHPALAKRTFFPGVLATHWRVPVASIQFSIHANIRSEISFNLHEYVTSGNFCMSIAVSALRSAYFSLADGSAGHGVHCTSMLLHWIRCWSQRGRDRLRARCSGRVPKRGCQIGG